MEEEEYIIWLWHGKYITKYHEEGDNVFKKN